MKTEFEVLVQRNLILLEKYGELIKQLDKIKHLISQSDFTQCQRCDGVGLPDCGDTDCSTYVLYKIREVVDASNQ